MKMKKKMKKKMKNLKRKTISAGRVITALKKIIVLADFKSVAKKFINQGIDADTVKKYLLEFKELKNKKDLGEYKDINYWGKKPFDELKQFIEKAKTQKSKSQEKKDEKVEGAELVAKNKDWLIYKILSHKAARKYGAGTRWCITEENGQRWREYSKNNNFYFIISRNPESIRVSGDEESPFYKIAVQVSKRGEKDITYWDAEDLSLTQQELERRMDKLRHYVGTLPDYKFEPFETTSDLSSIISKIKSTKILDEESKNGIEYFMGTAPVGYIPEQEFLILDRCKDINKFCEDWVETNDFLWNLKILSGDEYLEPEYYPSESEINDLLVVLEKKDKELYEKLIDKIFSNEEIASNIQDNDGWAYQDEEGDTPFTVDSFKKSKWKNKILANIIFSDVDVDLHHAFAWAMADASRAATENELFKTLERQMKACEYINFEGFWDTPIEVGISLNDIQSFGEDEGYIIQDIKDNLSKQIGVGNFNYEYPSDEEVVNCLIEYQLSEYCA